MGGVKHFVKTFPDAFVDFFNVYGTIRGLMEKKSGTETAILENFNGIVKPGEACSFHDCANDRCYLSLGNQTAVAQLVCELSQINAADTPISTAM